MSTRIKEFKSGKYEVLEHDEVPGYRPVFHIVLAVAVIYFILIFTL